MTNSHALINPKAPFLWYGGDYNPEQWPREIWQEDYHLMKEAGITVATVGVFSWVSLQPDEDTFTFEWLDDVINGLHENGIKVVLATPSAAQPAWMSEAYPDILRVGADGVRREHSGRVNYCPNSPDYRRFSRDIARRLADRYGEHPALLLWHISNEYHEWCYCDTCAEAFREWLKVRYGTLDEVNQRWWTAFWGHTYTRWSQIKPPRQHGQRLIHGQTLDYFRFMTDSNIACYTNERDMIRSITPDIPMTTNLMGFYKPFDYRKWAAELDVVSWDCYPRAHHTPGEIAIMHDLMRGIKDGQPYLLLEQTPSTANWAAIHALKRPGILRLWSYLAVAHGSESVMYFQWRRSRGGCEKLHGAIIDHAGRADARVFREVSQLGAELEKLGDSIVGSVTHSKIGIVFDWDNWHALDNTIGPVRDKRYRENINAHYLPFYRKNISVDIIFPDSDLSQYEIVIAPMMYMVKSEFIANVNAFVQEGGSFVATYYSGLVDETDLAFENGYPGPLSDVLGIWIEEFDALYPDQKNHVVWKGHTFECDHLVAITHTEGADVLTTFAEDFYAGMPAISRNEYGDGLGYFIGSNFEASLLDDFYGDLLSKHGIQPQWITSDNVEVTQRYKDDEALIFVLNHNNYEVIINLGDKQYDDLLNRTVVSGEIELGTYDVHILREVIPEGG